MRGSYSERKPACEPWSPQGSSAGCEGAEHAFSLRRSRPNYPKGIVPIERMARGLIRGVGVIRAAATWASMRRRKLEGDPPDLAIAHGLTIQGVIGKRIRPVLVRKASRAGAPRPVKGRCSNASARPIDQSQSRKPHDAGRESCPADTVTIARRSSLTIQALVVVPT